MIEDSNKPTFNRFAKKSVASPLPPPQTTQSRGSTGTKRQAALKAMQAKRFDDDFNPDTSFREKKKLEKRFNLHRSEIGKRAHDQNGWDSYTGIDLCDCLNVTCIGCFFPCPKCQGTKCGPDCRVTRKYRYESCEYHGYNYTIRNPLDSN